MCENTFTVYQNDYHAVCTIARMLLCQKGSVLFIFFQLPPAITSDLVPVLLQLCGNLDQFIELAENKLFLD